MSVSAVILVGGPRTTTHFRPLSLHVAQPLFPLGGKPMIYHHIKSCSQVEGLEEVFLVGDFEEDVFTSFIQDTSSELNIKLR
jgi:mannose-1-phosphate guanylyltransferase